jgi:pimeloyl-ACP methyl ester carboxylesterase
MPFAPVNGIDLYYEEHGEGTPIILAHGAGGNHLSWWQQVPALSRHWRTITFDHRGWGLSYDTDDRGPEAFIEDLGALLDYLNIEKAVLAGHSMGGYSCLGLAIAQPERVKGLLMSNTFAGMRREVWLAATDAQREAVRQVWERRGTEKIKRVLAPGFSRRHRNRAFLYKQIRLLNENGPNRLDRARQVQRLRALERPDETGATREQLAALPMPVFFLGGEHDEVFPVSLMKIAQSLLPDARMVVVPDAGHSVYFEAPDTFNELAHEFAASCVS